MKTFRKLSLSVLVLSLALVLYRALSGARERLTQFPGINSSPIFSPDGRQLALVLSRDGNPEIYVMNMADRRFRGAAACAASYNQTGEHHHKEAP